MRLVNLDQDMGDVRLPGPALREEPLKDHIANCQLKGFEDLCPGSNREFDRGVDIRTRKHPHFSRHTPFMTEATANRPMACIERPSRWPSEVEEV